MMARPELGSKRVCGECGAKFYDLNRNPIICPKCHTEFDPASLVATRAKPAREAPAKAAVAEVVPEAEEQGSDEELVALEEADEEEKATGRAEPDVEDNDLPDLEGDAIETEDEDEFLDGGEGDDDDVSSLIEGDLDKED